MKIETIEAASLPIIHTYSDRKFCAFFGVGTYEVAVIWYYIKETGLSLLRLLWALYFLKIYPTEDVGSSVVGVDRKTFMKHVKELTKIMNQWLPEFLWSSRWQYAHKNIASVIDVTPCKIYQPSVDQWEYYSYKSKFYALKYEVAISYHEPRIIWEQGPFKGAVADVTICRDHFIPALDHNEIALADKGYMGESDHLLTSYKGPKNDYERMISYKIDKKRQEIERINQRIKNFRCFETSWRGQDFEFQEDCFYAVCKIINILLEKSPLCAKE